jgi:hypothetical protein
MDINGAGATTNVLGNRVDVQQTTTGDWVDVAKMFGLFCEAVTAQTLFHRALLWVVFGTNLSKHHVHDVKEWVEWAIKGSAAPEKHTTFYGLPLPLLADAGNAMHFQHGCMQRSNWPLQTPKPPLETTCTAPPPLAKRGRKNFR